MTEEELNRLEALAKASTSGPWARHHDPQAYAVYQPEFECWIPQDGSDADFIAAANPATVLSLIALARVGLAVTPRPMAEAPGDTYVYAWHRVHNAWIAVRPISPDWWAEKTAFTHFIPLSAIPKPGGE